MFKIREIACYLNKLIIPIFIEWTYIFYNFTTKYYLTIKISSPAINKPYSSLDETLSLSRLI